MWNDIFKRFKDVEIQPRVLPERTLLMLKCQEYKYAKAFIDTGAMKFTTPSSWKPDLGVWHSIEVHEPSTIFEAKDGAYGK